MSFLFSAPFRPASRGRAVEPRPPWTRDAAIPAASQERFGIPRQGGGRALPQNFTHISYRDSGFYPRIKRINAWLKLAAQEARTWENPVLVDESPPVTFHVRRHSLLWSPLCDWLYSSVGGDPESAAIVV